MSSQVWVNDYTTRSGVHVAGHWRKGRHLVDACSEGESTTAAAQPQASASSMSHGPVSELHSRYRQAAVAAGLSALRQLRGAASDDEVRTALAARARAREDIVRAKNGGGGPADQPPVATAEDTTRCPGCGQFTGDGHQCPTPQGLPEGNYAGMTKDARVQAMLADLESAVQSIVQSGQLKRWLDAMVSNGLSRWSANNRILAAVQMLQRGKSLDELHLMGLRQWGGHERRVVKGAKAVWILAPVKRKVVEEEPGGSRNERHVVVGFRGVPVFDISDTEGKPLPSAPLTSAQGEVSPGTIEGLRQRVSEAGYAYEETQIAGCVPATGEGTLGYTDPQSKRIVVDSRLSPAQKASTIAHELGHVHCGHVDGDYEEYRQHRGRMETEAEITAYLVNRSRGMSKDQVEAFSPGYIAGWSKGEPAVMHNAIDKATRAYNKIMDGPWPP